MHRSKIKTKIKIFKNQVYKHYSLLQYIIDINLLISYIQNNILNNAKNGVMYYGHVGLVSGKNS